MYGPSDTWARMAQASSPFGGEVDDFSDIFDVRHWADGQAVEIGSVTVLPRAVVHPTEAYGLRFTDRVRRGADLQRRHRGVRRGGGPRAGRGRFLCEASWTHAPGERPENLHLSGTEAGEIAKQAGVGELLLTHIPPWTSREDVISEAKDVFDGPVRAVVCGEVFRVGR